MGTAGGMCGCEGYVGVRGSQYGGIPILTIRCPSPPASKGVAEDWRGEANELITRSIPPNPMGLPPSLGSLLGEGGINSAGGSTQPNPIGIEIEEKLSCRRGSLVLAVMQ